MTHVKSFSDYFEIYDWLKNWNEGQSPLGVEATLQEGLGAIVGAHALYRIPTLFVSRSEKRIRAIMVGWPCEALKENEPFPSMNPSGEYFFVRHLIVTPRYQGKKDFGFGDDIFSLWPKTKGILAFRKSGEEQVLEEIWSFKEEQKESH